MVDANNHKHRLIIISNRLPLSIATDLKGSLHTQPGSGGLVTALAPVLRNRGGIWIGWPGMPDLIDDDIKPIMQQATKKGGFLFEPILLSQEETDFYYHGFSNEILWPLFHDLQTHCNFVPEYWQVYQEVNRKFAAKAALCSRPDDFIWVHDYHLLLLGQELRKKGVSSKLGFFLHIPFPPLDIFLKLPWRAQILRAMLEYDLIGFQTPRDKRNFIQCVRTLIKDIHPKSAGNMNILTINQRNVRVGCFPISIDYNEFVDLAQSDEVAKQAWLIHETLPDRKLVLCVDRLDYTKGIPNRLNAFRTFLERYPQYHRNVSLVQIVVPSRTHIPKYQILKTEIDQLVGEINSKFIQQGWVPIHYMFRSLNRIELLAYYRTSEIALITPIKDGMNLVAKEYAASNIEENGVLILSEFAGAAAQLHRNALLVNPYDIDGVAEAIHKAYQMPKNERHERMRKMRRSIKTYDVFWWVKSFLSAAFSKDLVDFPPISDQVITQDLVNI